MSNKTLPILVAGAAAIFLLGGKSSKRKKKSKDSFDGYSPATDGLEPEPAPGPGPAPGDPEPPTPAPDPHRDVGQTLLELGYQGYSPISVAEFQKDWNEAMLWMYKYNPKISPSTPKYGTIGVDGVWGGETEARAMRALSNVPPGSGVEVEVFGKIIAVSSFRDMVHKIWAIAKSASDGKGGKIKSYSGYDHLFRDGECSKQAFEDLKRRPVAETGAYSERHNCDWPLTCLKINSKENYEWILGKSPSVIFYCPKNYEKGGDTHWHLSEDLKSESCIILRSVQPIGYVRASDASIWAGKNIEPQIVLRKSEDDYEFIPWSDNAIDTLIEKVTGFVNK